MGVGGLLGKGFLGRLGQKRVELEYEIYYMNIQLVIKKSIVRPRQAFQAPSACQASLSVRSLLGEMPAEEFALQLATSVFWMPCE